MTRKWGVLLALIYPFTLASIVAGFLAFVMIFLKIDLHLISASVLWFYFACTISIYSITAKALKVFGLRRYFLAFIAVVGLLAVLATLALFLGG